MDIIWISYFVKCQGYDIDEYVVYQDNMSALLLEKNGRVSSSRCTMHIKAKYFLIKDYYDASKIDVRFCPTDEMWADVLTKPLQGQKFRDMRAFLQNCPQDYNNDNKLKKSMNLHDVASLRECVSEHTKPLLKSRPASPTCISQIVDNFPGGKPEVIWGRNKINTFPVNSKFPIGRTWELRHDKIKNQTPPSSLYFSCPN
jgi:hypothetical protein